MEALHSALNFSDTRSPAIGSMTRRIKLFPKNGNSFGEQTDIQIDLPSNMFGTYMDYSFKTQLKFKFTMPAGPTLTLDKAGIASIFARKILQTETQNLFDLTHMNVLECAMTDITGNQMVKMNQDLILEGKGNQVGQTLAAATVYQFSMTLNYDSFANASKYIPLFSREPVSLILTTDSIANYGVWSADPAALTAPISDVELITELIQLTPQAQALVDTLCNKRYEIITTNILNNQTPIAAGTLNTSIILPVNVASLEKVLVVWRQASVENRYQAFSSGGRCNPSLTSFQMAINSVNYPNRAITGTATQCSEYLAETLSAFHMFGKNVPCSLNAFGTNVQQMSTAQSIATSPYLLAGNGAVATNSNGSTTGSFCMALDLSTLVEGHADELYNGVNTQGGNTELRATYSATPNAMLLDVFMFVTQRLTLDMKEDGSWQALE